MYVCMCGVPLLLAVFVACFLLACHCTPAVNIRFIHVVRVAAAPAFAFNSPPPSLNSLARIVVINNNNLQHDKNSIKNVYILMYQKIKSKKKKQKNEMNKKQQRRKKTK